MKTAERYYGSGGNCLGKISLVKSAMQIARYGGIKFRRASDVNIVTGFFLPLCFYFLMLGHQEVLAAPARVEGRVKCYKSVGKNECFFTIWLTGEDHKDTSSKKAKKWGVYSTEIPDFNFARNGLDNPDFRVRQADVNTRQPLVSRE
jgi:hypothetical protein